VAEVVALVLGVAHGVSLRVVAGRRPAGERRHAPARHIRLAAQQAEHVRVVRQEPAEALAHETRLAHR
jgi:hypothetical protein